MTGGDKQLAVEVLGLFREQGEVWLRLLAPDTPTQDFAIAAHTIKGAARGIGAWALGEVCGQAEAVANAGPMTRDARTQWGDTITLALDEAIQEIARIEHQLALASLRS
jgi:HPt (histidine-containing phosphotransfer) domain-containing protein